MIHTITTGPQTPPRSDLNQLTTEQVQQRKYQLWTSERQVTFQPMAGKKKIVAEGDSWFDYPPGLDILDHLVDLGHAMRKIASAGDSLENMVFGTKFGLNFSRKPNPLDHTIQLLIDDEADLLLFSGGGNDIAGDAFDAYFDHKDLNASPFRTAYADEVILKGFRDTYVKMITRVRDEVSPDLHIIAHGYGNAIPDGRAVINLPFGFKFGGPWLRPTLTRKNIVAANEQRTMVTNVVSRINDMLKSIATDPQFQDHFHYVDLRPIIQDTWWVNELHLTNAAFLEAAKAFDDVIDNL